LIDEYGFHVGYAAGRQQVNGGASAEVDVWRVQPKQHVLFVFVYVSQYRENEVIWLTKPHVQL
jgi:hypothetical protein